jgi:hypothetical protein
MQGATLGSGVSTRYLEEIRRPPLLEPEQETLLAKRWREHGDGNAAHQLVTSHLRLVNEPSEQQPESKPTPWFAAAASATARTALFAVGAAVGADQALSGSMTRVLTVPGPPGAASSDGATGRVRGAEP